MIGKICAYSRCRRAALALLLIGLPLSARAASISYPSVGPLPPGFMFTNIVESSVTDGVPLYGAPSPIVVGLGFNPTPAFSATSTNGGADLTDGQLNFTVMAGPMSGGIPQINVNEGGLFTLTGPGTGATQVFAGAIIRATVLEINGAPVSPFALSPVSASVNYNVVANPGLNQIWNLNLNLDVNAQLALLGFDPNQRATKAEVAIDNSLVAISELMTVARITKTDFDITLIVPEPASMSLLGVAICGLAIGRKRQAC
jgi:hypothetical protein